MVDVKVLSGVLAIELVGDLLFKVGEVELVLAVLDVAEELGPLTHEEGTTSEEVAGGAKGSRVHVGYRENPTLE